GCSAPISARYPFVEALAAVVLVGLWLRFGPSLEFAIAGPFTLALIVLFFTDLD
ncbi:MAG: prepilin peptidase, partial [Actinobacteria bacterium]|nr:prepilin peptidase [Actinomycetota bacterium]NIT95561.1 prepilin peptidase [Actinomycetota bacterium]NIV55741.1 prepilin peptidase [Actinomycetota bacterium]NIW28194.1 prepilin peptidase [Actinomycetota bacterium]NIX20704.1 prepilin peptidase [Actinomycetota bacterium]